MRANTKRKYGMGKRFAVLMKRGFASRRHRWWRCRSHRCRGRYGLDSSPHVAPALAREQQASLHCPSLDVFGAIDRQGAVTYAFGGEVGLQRQSPSDPPQRLRPASRLLVMLERVEDRPVALKCNQPGR